MKRLLAVLVAVPVAVVALSGVAAASKSGDQKIAKKSLLKASDVPKSLKKQPASASSGSDDDLGAFPECKTYNDVKDKAVKARTAKATIEFADATAIERVSENIGLTKDTGPVKQLVAAFGASDTATCLQQALHDVVANETQADPSTVEVTVQRARLPKLGDQRAGYEIGMSIPAAQGTTQELGVSFVAVRVGRATAIFQFQTVGDLVDKRDGILKTAVKRMKAAQ